MSYFRSWTHITWRGFLNLIFLTSRKKKKGSDWDWNMLFNEICGLESVPHSRSSWLKDLFWLYNENLVPLPRLKLMALINKWLANAWSTSPQRLLIYQVVKNSTKRQLNLWKNLFKVSKVYLLTCYYITVDLMDF